MDMDDDISCTETPRTLYREFSESKLVIKMDDVGCYRMLLDAVGCCWMLLDDVGRFNLELHSPNKISVPSARNRTKISLFFLQ